jgi:hypothetical protein
MPRVISASYHRNGVAGVPFYVGIVSDPFDDGEDAEYLIQHIPAESLGEPNTTDPVTTALRMDRLPDIRFGLNSWRGDRVTQSVLDEIMVAAQENHWIGRSPENNKEAVS